MSFSNLKLGTKLGLGFASVLALLILVAFIGMNRLALINANLEEIIKDDNQKIQWAYEMSERIGRIGTASRSIALATGVDAVQKQLKLIETARSEYRQDFENLSRTVKSDQGKNLLAELVKSIEPLRALNEKVATLGLEGKYIEAGHLVSAEVDPAQEAVIQVLDNLIAFQKSRSQQSADEANSAYAFARWLMMGLCLVAVLAGSSIAFLLTRGITGPINRIIDGLTQGSDQVASAAHQVSGASQSLAEGTQEQASAIEETSSSLEEMSSMTKTNAENANQANAIVANSKKDMQGANQAMTDLVSSMNQISKASEETQKIVKTIDEIAFQTNLLALNAAVEAARAGEAGAGFAVVAEEVRNLAMRAADAAKNTANLIEGTVKKVKDGTDLVGRTHESFVKVADGSTRIGQLVDEIAAASNEQAQGIDQLNRAVSEMDKVVQQNAASAEESASASEEMNAQAQHMKVVVQDLIELVGGNNHYAAASPSKGGIHKPARKSGLPSKASGSKALRTTKGTVVRPDQVIPMRDDEFQDF